MPHYYGQPVLANDDTDSKHKYSHLFSWLFVLATCIGPIIQLAIALVSAPRLNLILLIDLICLSVCALIALLFASMCKLVKKSYVIASIVFACIAAAAASYAGATMVVAGCGACLWAGLRFFSDDSEGSGYVTKY